MVAVKVICDSKWPGSTGFWTMNLKFSFDWESHLRVNRCGKPFEPWTWRTRRASSFGLNKNFDSWNKIARRGPSRRTPVLTTHWHTGKGGRKNILRNSCPSSTGMIQTEQWSITLPPLVLIINVAHWQSNSRCVLSNKISFYELSNIIIACKGILSRYINGGQGCTQSTLLYGL